MDTYCKNTDALSGLRSLPCASVDLFMTDPPYASGGISSVARKMRTRDKYTDTDYDGAASLPSFTGDNMDQRSWTAFMRDVFIEARRAAKPAAICASFIDWRQIPALSDALQGAGWTWRGIAVWDKKSSRPQKGRYANQCEYILWASNGDLPTERGVGCLRGLFSEVNVAGDKRHHQTEKPVGIMRALIEIAPVGSVVCDPFAGSGSTGVACVETGRGFIGFEISDYYCDVTNRRIADAVGRAL